MDGNIDTVREAIDEIQNIKWIIDEGPAHVKLTEAQDRLTKLKASLSAIDSDAIRRKFWDELHAEAETQYDRRLELLGPIETLDDAAFRKTLGDGWSAWLLAKKIIENRRAAILSAEPALNMPKCTKPDDAECHANSRGRCYNGFQCKPAQDDGKAESEESKDERLATKQLLGAGCHDECGPLPEEDQ